VGAVTPEEPGGGVELPVGEGPVRGVERVGPKPEVRREPVAGANAEPEETLLAAP
jgi:hypothetical protein